MRLRLEIRLKSYKKINDGDGLDGKMGKKTNIICQD